MDHLRRHKLGGTTHGEERSLVQYEACEPKVRKDRPAVGTKQHVLRLEIAVHDPECMQALECEDEACSVEAELGFVHRSKFGKYIPQLAAQARGHHHMQMRRVLSARHQVDDPAAHHVRVAPLSARH